MGLGFEVGWNGDLNQNRDSGSGVGSGSFRGFDRDWDGTKGL